MTARQFFSQPHVIIFIVVVFTVTLVTLVESIKRDRRRR